MNRRERQTTAYAVAMPPYLARFDPDDWPGPPLSYLAEQRSGPTLGGRTFSRAELRYLWRHRSWSVARLTWKRRQTNPGYEPPDWCNEPVRQPIASRIRGY